MKKIFILLLITSCSYNPKPRTINMDCHPTTPQSLEAQPRESFCYTIRFVK